jgi:hypothetical protein
MTTEQTMLVAHPASPSLGWMGFLWSRLTAGALVLAALVVIQAVAGCAQKEPRLKAPQVLVSPYDASRGEVLWAVVPLRNESGTTIADTYLVSDKVVAAASQVRGVRCLPLNRTIGAMRSLEMTELTNPADAEKLAKALGADGLIVGSITTYDPYNPPKLGLALALYTRPGLVTNRPAANSGTDTRKLTFQPTDYQYFPRSAHQDAPASVVSEFLDGKNHQVLMDVQAYAEGRHDERTALGWRRYLASMDLFSEFGAWHSVNRLLEHEWIRSARVTSGETVNQQP